MGLVKEFLLSDICINYTASEIATAALYMGDRFSRDLGKKESSLMDTREAQEKSGQQSTQKFVNISTDVSQYQQSS